MTSVRATRAYNHRGLTSRPIVRRDRDYRSLRCISGPRRGTIPVVDGVSIVGFDDFQDVRRPAFRYVGQYALNRDYGASI
jgi:hypothetical protein